MMEDLGKAKQIWLKDLTKTGTIYKLFLLQHLDVTGSTSPSVIEVQLM